MDDVLLEKLEEIEKLFGDIEHNELLACCTVPHVTNRVRVAYLETQAAIEWLKAAPKPVIIANCVAYKNTEGE